MKVRNLMKSKMIGVSLGLILGAFSHIGFAQNCDSDCDQGCEVEQEKTIVDIAVSNPDFSTLVTALTEADLVGALQGEGPFTVFAPTNEAFNKLPEGVLSGLLADKAALKNVLLYHVVGGAAVPAETAVTLEAATMLNGEGISLEVRDGKLFLNDNIQVIVTDIEASNGIIHVIDGVLVP